MSFRPARTLHSETLPQKTNTTKEEKRKRKKKTMTMVTQVL